MHTAMTRTCPNDRFIGATPLHRSEPIIIIIILFLLNYYYYTIVTVVIFMSLSRLDVTLITLYAMEACGNHLSEQTLN